GSCELARFGEGPIDGITQLDAAAVALYEPLLRRPGYRDGEALREHRPASVLERRAELHLVEAVQLVHDPADWRIGLSEAVKGEQVVVQAQVEPDAVGSRGLELGVLRLCSVQGVIQPRLRARRGVCYAEKHGATKHHHRL